SHPKSPVRCPRSTAKGLRMTKMMLKTNAGRSFEWTAPSIKGFRGPVLRPDDDGYSASRSIWNAMIDRKPGLILRCTGVADVIEAARFVAQHDLLVSVRGGGHNIAGSALCDGGVLIDLSNMRAVQVYPEERRVTVQGGAL